MRVALLIEYDGTEYAGWQRQDNALGIQQVVEEAILATTGQKVVVTAAGRTDAGVHALGQVAHFDIDTTIPTDRFALVLNTRLPYDIRIIGSREVPAGFHAQYGAVSKTYRYTIHNSPYGTAIGLRFCHHVPRKLDDGVMRETALRFVGKRDFRACMASGSKVKSTVREVYFAKVWREAEKIYFEICANGFLYNMVRIITGTLISAGLGKITADEAEKLLETGDRRLLGYTAPARGLALVSVSYSPEIF